MKVLEWSKGILLSKSKHSRLACSQHHGFTMAQFFGFGALFLVGVLLSSCCTSKARVCNVWRYKRTFDVGVADREIFLNDRASRFKIEPGLLPANKQGEEFYVSWTGRDVDLVRFECRQVNRPSTIIKRDYSAGPRRHTVFSIRGDDYREGGSVSAWRVTLWNEGQLMAEKTSALW